MPSPKTTPNTPSASTLQRDERARDSAQAMQEYRAEQQAVLARTERLRAQRLSEPAPAIKKPAAKKPAAKSAAKAPSGKASAKTASSKPISDKTASKIARKKAP